MRPVWNRTRDLIVVGGVSGAGKTTLCRAIASGTDMPFVTNEEINQRLFGGAGDKTTVFRHQLEETQRLLREASSFVLEHTLKGHYVSRLFGQADKLGYRKFLIYIRIADLDLAQERVNKRHKAGGHHVDPDEIAERLRLGAANFLKLRECADAWFELDNTHAYSLTSCGGVLSESCRPQLQTVCAEAIDGLTS